MLRSKKYLVHDEQNQLGVGDKVSIIETRPLSKRKNWRLLNVVEKSQ
jgi:small subunit ribosomal protein S17